MSQATTLPEAAASAEETSQGGRSYPFLLVPISLFFLLLGLAVLRSPSLVTSAGIGSAIIVATPLILATYALMAVVIAGRGTVDLSVGPLIGFVNVTLIQLHGAGVLENPFAVFGNNSLTDIGELDSREQAGVGKSAGERDHVWTLRLIEQVTDLRGRSCRGTIA